MDEYVSDLDINCETPCKYGIQWVGPLGPHWQWLDTEAEREAALKAHYLPDLNHVPEDNDKPPSVVNELESDDFFEMEAKIDKYENDSLSARPW